MGTTHSAERNAYLQKIAIRIETKINFYFLCYYYRYDAQRRAQRLSYVASCLLGPAIFSEKLHTECVLYST